MDARCSLTPDRRLIVALDVPTHDAALKMVDTLENVAFFKVGWELGFAGDLLALLPGSMSGAGCRVAYSLT